MTVGTGRDGSGRVGTGQVGSGRPHSRVPLARPFRVLGFDVHTLDNRYAHASHLVCTRGTADI
eukprot:3201055-Pyramimonas_sp.AAC.1